MSTKVEMFKTEDCGRCPAVVELLEEIEREHDIDLEIVDAEKERVRALARDVVSVPSVVIDEETKLTGVPARERIVEELES